MSSNTPLISPVRLTRVEATTGLDVAFGDGGSVKVVVEWGVAGDGVAEFTEPHAAANPATSVRTPMVIGRPRCHAPDA
jgi:hypothetical protein